MAKVTFVLKEPNASVETPINLIFRWDQERVKISTRQMVEPRYWDKSKQRVKSTINVSDFSRINNELSLIDNTLKSIFDDFILRFERKPNHVEIKNIFEVEYFEKKPKFKKEQNKTILDYFDDYINTIESSRVLSTVRKYKQAKNNFIEFQKLNNVVYNVDMLDIDFRNKYISFLTTTKKYAPTTLYRQMKFLKTMLLFTEGLGVKIHPFIKNTNFLTKDVEVENIALTSTELSELENLDLSKNLRLEKVRDLFLIGCYTGQRFSDLNKINKSNIVDNQYISIRQQKTNEPITLPLLKSVKNILIKYDYQLPKISNVKFNKYIKEVGELCKTLNTPFKQDGPLLRYEMIGSHTARRTFVTLNYSKGIDLKTLSIATGHRQMRSINTYVKMSDQQQADLLRSKLEPLEAIQPGAKIVDFNKVVNQ